MSPLVSHVKRMKKIYPDALIVLWASLECTNFSKAKGGQPRDADSRTLAEHLFRYIEAIDPDYIQIENVEEFMSWGDMDEHGHPISKDKGRCYEKWKRKVRKYGYDLTGAFLTLPIMGHTPLASGSSVSSPSVDFRLCSLNLLTVKMGSRICSDDWKMEAGQGSAELFR